MQLPNIWVHIYHLYVFYLSYLFYIPFSLFMTSVWVSKYFDYFLFPLHLLDGYTFFYFSFSDYSRNVHPRLSYSLFQTIIFTTSLIDIRIFYLLLLLPTFCVILCILIYIYLKHHDMLIWFCFVKSTLIYIFPFFFYLFSYSSFLLTFLYFHLGSSLFYLNKFLSCFF